MIHPTCLKKLMDARTFTHKHRNTDRERDIVSLTMDQPSEGRIISYNNSQSHKD